MSPKNIFLAICFVFVSVFAMTAIVSGGGNQIGTLIKYLSYVVIVMAFFRPMVGFWVMVVSMGYIDFIKRLMVIGDYLSFLDVTILLAFPPILSYVTFIGILIKMIFGRSFSQRQFRLLLLWFFLSLVMGLLALGGGKAGGLGLLQSIANFIGYIPLVFVMPHLFKTRLQVILMLKTMIWIFLPVAIYAAYQKYVGLADFEIDYLMTGFSLESRILSGQDFRYFSTMNSSQNLSKFAAMLGAISLLLCKQYKDNLQTRKVLNVFTKFMFVSLFLYAALVSGARTGLVMGFIAIITYFIFKSRVLTIITYIVGICSFVFVLSVSSYVVESKILSVWSAKLAQMTPEWLPLQTNLGTMTIRFIGFSQWTEPGFWQPFGYQFSSLDYKQLYPHHDALTNIVLKFGYVPVIVLVSIGGFLMFKFHKQILKKNIYDNTIYICVALVFCILFGSLATANLSTFPINLLLYMFIGLTVVFLNDTKNNDNHV